MFRAQESGIAFSSCRTSPLEDVCVESSLPEEESGLAHLAARSIPGFTRITGRWCSSRVQSLRAAIPRHGPGSPIRSRTRYPPTLQAATGADLFALDILRGSATNDYMPRCICALRRAGHTCSARTALLHYVHTEVLTLADEIDPCLYTSRPRCVETQGSATIRVRRIKTNKEAQNTNAKDGFPTPWGSPHHAYWDRRTAAP